VKRRGHRSLGVQVPSPPRDLGKHASRGRGPSSGSSGGGSGVATPAGTSGGGSGTTTAREEEGSEESGEEEEEDQGSGQESGEESEEEEGSEERSGEGSGSGGSGASSVPVPTVELAEGAAAVAGARRVLGVEVETVVVSMVDEERGHLSVRVNLGRVVRLGEGELTFWCETLEN
jgi:hypothetical protein